MHDILILCFLYPINQRTPKCHDVSFYESQKVLPNAFLVLFLLVSDDVA
jgi:hypothetical protein